MTSTPGEACALVALVALAVIALASSTASSIPSALAADTEHTSSSEYAVAREAVILAVLDDNRDLASARSTWEASRQQPTQARALPDPTLTWSLAPGSLGSTDVAAGHRVELRQALPFPGSLAPRAEAAAAHAEAIGGDLDALRRWLALEAAGLFDELAQIDASLVLLGDHALLLEDLQASAEARYAAARSGAQDPLQAEVELAHVEHRVVVLGADRRVAAARLSALLHGPADAPAEVPTLLVPPWPPAPPPERRPELLAAEARERAAAQTVTAERRGALPDLAVMGSYNSMWMAPQHQWMVGIGVELPVQVAGRRAEIREAEALAQAATASREALEDELAADLEQAQARFAEALHVVALYDERLLPTARTRVEVARAAFEAGVEDFDTLIDAERGLREDELGRVSAVARAWTRHAELRLAAGLLPLSTDPSEVTP